MKKTNKFKILNEDGVVVAQADDPIATAYIRMVYDTSHSIIGPYNSYLYPWDVDNPGMDDARYVSARLMERASTNGRGRQYLRSPQSRRRVSGLESKKDRGTKAPGLMPSRDKGTKAWKNQYGEGVNWKDRKRSEYVTSDLRKAAATEKLPFS